MDTKSEKKKKRRREEAILDYISANEISSQQEILSHLSKLNLGCTQPTVSKYIKALDYELRDGVYKKKEDAIAKEERRILFRLLKHSSPTISLRTNFSYVMIIDTEVGLEHSIATSLYKVYGKECEGIFPGIGKILVVFTSKKYASRVSNTLKNYSSGEFVRKVEKKEIETDEQENIETQSNIDNVDK